MFSYSTFIWLFRSALCCSCQDPNAWRISCTATPNWNKHDITEQTLKTEIYTTLLNKNWCGSLSYSQPQFSSQDVDAMLVQTEIYTPSPNKKLMWLSPATLPVLAGLHYVHVLLLQTGINTDNMHWSIGKLLYLSNLPEHSNSHAGKSLWWILKAFQKISSAAGLACSHHSSFPTI